MRSVRKAALFAALGVSAIAACHGAGPHSPAGQNAAPAAKHDGQVHSNIARADYAGSAACARCHAKEYAAWLDSPMHRMTRDLHQTQIRAPFNGSSFAFRDDSVHMEQIGSERFMRLHTARGQETLYRVTKVIGGRYREDFIGAEVDPNAPLGTARDAERILPASYLAFNGEWRYKGYSVMVRERPDLEPGVVWKTACIFCHNTTPSLSLLLDDMYGAGAHTYQGSVSVELPDDKRPHYVVTDDAALKAALGAELEHLGRPRDTENLGLKRALTAAIDGTRDNFDEKDLVELGIGCEACHGGAREHVQDPTRVRPTLALRSDFLQVTTESGAEPTHAEDINRTCAKCHTVLFSRYPYTWEGQTRRHGPGGSSINSGEARDFLLGDCNTQLSCVHCHDPHTEDPKSALQALEGPRGDELCASCHKDLQSAAARHAHTHHAAESSGSHCVNCHMPKKNMGLAYELTRYHRIGSPTDRERVEGDRPLECALCHTDKSVAQLVATMERFWGKKYDRDALRKLYGQDLTVNAVEATLRYGKPHEEGTAVALAGRDRRQDWLPLVVAQLGNEYPLVRYFARHAVEQINGAPLPVDLNAPGADAIKSAQKYLGLHVAPERQP
ncbi:MAG TPA: cytochrome c3 family protein [Polyangiaceae bacterium]